MLNLIVWPLESSEAEYGHTPKPFLRSLEVPHKKEHHCCHFSNWGSWGTEADVTVPAHPAGPWQRIHLSGVMVWSETHKARRRAIFCSLPVVNIPWGRPTPSGLPLMKLWGLLFARCSCGEDLLDFAISTKIREAQNVYSRFKGKEIYFS